MAVLTLAALRALVDIVLQVTRVARCSQRRFENRLDVTIIAGKLLMGSVQIEICLLRMIESDLCPIVIRVTARAIRNVVPLVFVVVEVATHAVHLQLIPEWIVAMTRVTAQVGVAAQKVEVGITEMVEARIGP